MERDQAARSRAVLVRVALESRLALPCPEVLSMRRLLDLQQELLMSILTPFSVRQRGQQRR